MPYLTKFSKAEHPERCRYDGCGSTKTIKVEEYNINAGEIERFTFVCERHFEDVKASLFEHGARIVNKEG